MKNYSLKEKIREIINILFYIAFLFYLFFVFRYEQNTLVKWIVACFGLVALAIAIHAEYLKLTYHKALYALNFQLDPAQAIAYYNQVEKWDFFHSYKKNRLIFDIQVYLFQERPQDILDIIENHSQFFHSSVEHILIAEYYQLRSYLLLNSHNQIKAVYAKISEIRSLKKPPLLFSFDEIDAIYYLGCNNLKKAVQCFQKVNQKYMNPKERSFILSNLIHYCDDPKKAEYQSQLNQLLESSTPLYTTKESQKKSL